MDALVYFLMGFVGLGAAALAYLMRPDGKALGGMAAFIFVVAGFGMLLTGIDVPYVYNHIQNVSSVDSYVNGYNTTYNFSFIQNVSTSLNKTWTDTYAVTNYYTQWTQIFAFLLIAFGAVIGFEVFGKA